MIDSLLEQLNSSLAACTRWLCAAGLLTSGLGMELRAPMQRRLAAAHAISNKICINRNIGAQRPYRRAPSPHDASSARRMGHGNTKAIYASTNHGPHGNLHYISLPASFILDESRIITISQQPPGLFR